ncbi:uncharacterized protein LOC121740501 [Aricia agestis]|uniref:uncharacterized protein LOC121740501 n=1 Tax=Aricia agestis TaxID=91739 RepID=UPI001C209E38|nr:uncharacterized protein LOC121740501 [Aricia agestis]
MRYISGTFVWTKRAGKHPLLLLDGYTYSYQKSNAYGRVSWYCSRRLKGCRAAAVSLGRSAVASKSHNHPPPNVNLSDDGFKIPPRIRPGRNMPFLGEKVTVGVSLCEESPFTTKSSSSLESLEWSPCLPKRRKKVLTLQDKNDILKALRKGELGIRLAKKYGVGSSTISDIKKKADTIMHKIEKLEKKSPSRESPPLCSPKSIVSLRKKKNLNLREKIDILEALKEGEVGKNLAVKYGVGNSTITDIKKNAETIMEQKEILYSEEWSNFKELKKTSQLSVLDEILYSWLLERQSSGESTTASAVCDKAMELYATLGGNDNFLANEKWLQRFKARHFIKSLEHNIDKKSKCKDETSDTE